MYNTGCRVSELINLCVSDITLSADSASSICFYGKERKERVTPIWKSTASYIRNYIFDNSLGNEDHLFKSQHNANLTCSRAGEFCRAEVEVYGKKETIRYYSTNLLWGQKLYQELRFVLVEMNSVWSILASTSLELDPLSIIRLYSYRFWIECTFWELKQQTGAFCYHFWSKYMPKLSYYRKKEEPSALACVEDEKSRPKVLEAVRATEMHMALSCIAMGILQSLSICSRDETCLGQFRYQRTPSRGEGVGRGSHGLFTEAFFRLLGKQPELRITQIIQEQQDESGNYWGSWVS